MYSPDVTREDREQEYQLDEPRRSGFICDCVRELIKKLKDTYLPRKEIIGPKPYQQHKQPPETSTGLRLEESNLKKHDFPTLMGL